LQIANCRLQIDLLIRWQSAKSSANQRFSLQSAICNLKLSFTPFHVPFVPNR